MHGSYYNRRTFCVFVFIYLTRDVGSWLDWWRVSVFFVVSDDIRLRQSPCVQMVEFAQGGGRSFRQRSFSLNSVCEGVC